jgi:hypothetical protein
MPDAASYQFWSMAYTHFQFVMGGDDLFWHGWFARHDNRLRYLGDIAADYLDADLKTPAAALILLFLALMGALARENFRPAKAPVRQRIARKESKKSARKTLSR